MSSAGSSREREDDTQGLLDLAASAYFALVRAPACSSALSLSAEDGKMGSDSESSFGASRKRKWFDPLARSGGWSTSAIDRGKRAIILSSRKLVKAIDFALS